MNTPEEKSFYKDASVTHHGIFLLASLCMIGFSIYLTSHYFEVKYPSALGSASLCDINAFFNCDTATTSPASNILGVPISILGILAGVFLLLGYLFGGKGLEGTNHVLLIINAILCTGLFLYSLIVLRGLCPFCTLYYIASWVALFVLFKTSTIKAFDPKVLSSYFAITAIVFGLTYNHVQGKQENKSKLAKGLIEQYDNLALLGAPSFDSEFRIASATPNFSDAPIRVTKFSDFECPACKVLSDILSKIARKYKGKINIQYFFYPLDINCNSSMTRQSHANACNASYVSVCLPEKFKEIEHEIFALQKKGDFAGGIKKIVERENIKDCFEAPETKEKVISYIKEAKPFNVRSTPTFLLNGKKIEGSLPIDQLSILIDELLKRSQQ